MSKSRYTDGPRPVWSHDEKMILIEMAEQFPVLWDTSYPFYRELTQRKKALEEIHQVLGSSHTVYRQKYSVSFEAPNIWKYVANPEELHFSVEDINAQWRNLKDVFHKKKAAMEQRSDKRGEPQSDPVWRYYGPLKFLLSCEEDRKNNLRKRFQGSYEIAQLRQLRYRRQAEIAARRKLQEEREKDLAFGVVPRIRPQHSLSSDPLSLQRPQPLHMRNVSRGPALSIPGNSLTSTQQLISRLVQEEDDIVARVKLEEQGVEFDDSSVNLDDLSSSSSLKRTLSAATRMINAGGSAGSSQSAVSSSSSSQPVIVKEEIMDEDDDDIIECTTKVTANSSSKSAVTTATTTAVANSGDGCGQTSSGEDRDGKKTEMTNGGASDQNGAPVSAESLTKSTATIAASNLSESERTKLIRRPPSLASSASLSNYRRWHKRQMDVLRYSPYAASSPSTSRATATATVLTEEGNLVLNGDPDYKNISLSPSGSDACGSSGPEKFKYFAQYVESALLDINQQSSQMARRLVRDIYTLIAEHQTQLR